MQKHVSGKHAPIRHVLGHMPELVLTHVPDRHLLWLLEP